MDANPYTLRQILNPERRYVIPTYQRDYEWTRDGQWQLLFDDLEEVANRLEISRSMSRAMSQDVAAADGRVGPHFLGAIVLDQLPTPAGGLDMRAVIDGQQRLITLHLLLRGLSDALTKIGSSRVTQMRRLLKNPDDLARNTDELHKVWPRRRDRDTWRAVMADDLPTGNHAYNEARRYFLGRSEAFIDTGGDTESRASLLVDAVLDKFRLVVIDLDEHDDAQVIFEVLNGRQTPLTAADLVKNLLFMRAEAANEGHLDELYDRYWGQFDDDWWKTEVGRGHAARRRTDMLLAAWLTATTGDDANPGRLYAQIRSHVVLRREEIRDTLAQINRFAREYRVVNGAQGEPNGRIATAYSRINSLGVTTALPILLWLRTLERNQLSEADHLSSVVAVESFIIRRFLIGAQTRGYGQIFAEVLGKAKASAAAGSNISDALQKALASNTQSREWPTDYELTQELLTRRFYGVDAAQRIRLILGVIDQRMRANNPRRESATFDYERLTIEHVMPQAWGDHWPLPPAVGEADRLLASQRRDQAVNRLGNLTLVTQALNPALSNAPWAQKRPELAKYSDLMLNAEIVTCEAWDEAAIDNRARRMAAVIQEEWPAPPPRAAP